MKYCVAVALRLCMKMSYRCNHLCSFSFCFPTVFFVYFFSFRNVYFFAYSFFQDVILLSCLYRILMKTHIISHQVAQDSVNAHSKSFSLLRLVDILKFR